MTQPLYELFDELLRNAAATTEGRETLMRFNHVLNFDVLDGESFHADIDSGEADIQTGEAPPTPIMDAHNIRANEETFRDWFEGRIRYSDAIHEHRMYPQAAHTTKRHIDNWVTKLVRLGLGRPGLKDEY